MNITTISKLFYLLYKNSITVSPLANSPLSTDTISCGLIKSLVPGTCRGTRGHQQDSAAPLSLGKSQVCDRWVSAKEGVGDRQDSMMGSLGFHLPDKSWGSGRQGQNPWDSHRQVL